MTYLTCTLKSGLPLLIIPDTDAHMDGHPVLTWTYSIYRNNDLFEDDMTNDHEIHHHDVANDLLREKEANLHLEKKLDESYLGFITIEQAESKIFYTADGGGEISYMEEEEVIGQILNYRQKSQLWKY